MCVCVYTRKCRCLWKSCVLHPLELELVEVFSQLTWVQGRELRSYINKVASALSFWAISFALHFKFLQLHFLLKIFFMFQFFALKKLKKWLFMEWKLEILKCLLGNRIGIISWFLIFQNIDQLVIFQKKKKKATGRLYAILATVQVYRTQTATCSTFLLIPKSNHVWSRAVTSSLLTGLGYICAHLCLSPVFLTLTDTAWGRCSVSVYHLFICCLYTQHIYILS